MVASPAAARGVVEAEVVAVADGGDEAWEGAAAGVESRGEGGGAGVVAEVVAAEAVGGDGEGGDEEDEEAGLGGGEG